MGDRLYIIIHVCIHITYVLLRVWVCCIHEKSSTIMLLLVSTITPYSHLSSPQSSNETHSYPKYIFILWFLTKELPLSFFFFFELKRWIKDCWTQLIMIESWSWIYQLIFSYKNSKLYIITCIGQSLEIFKLKIDIFSALFLKNCLQDINLREVYTTRTNIVTPFVCSLSCSCRNSVSL